MAIFCVILMLIQHYFGIQEILPYMLMQIVNTMVLVELITGELIGLHLSVIL